MPDQPTIAELMHNANVNVKEKSDQDYILQFLKGEQIRYYHTTKFDNWFCSAWSKSKTKALDQSRTINSL